jgi:ribosome-binding protein aMBF1 (putative translation factor)
MRAQALRGVRRAQRRLDTTNEVLERRLDRAIENKERITIGLMMSVVEDYKHIVSRTRELEVMVTSALQIFNSIVTTKLPQ